MSRRAQSTVALRPPTMPLSEAKMKYHPRAIPFLFLVLLMVLGCGAGGGRSVTNAKVITLEEIRASNQTNSHALVQALRPTWLLARGRDSLTQAQEIKVYLDGMLLGGVEYLKQIPTNSIAQLRYYDGLEATQRWGLDHGLGAIAAVTREPGG